MRLTGTSTGHYAWGDGCGGWRLLADDSVTVTRERMPPGASETWHRHDRARQFFFILNGVLELEVASDFARLSVWQGGEVPPGVVHRVVNSSNSDADFLVIAAPSAVGDRIECEPPTIPGDAP